MPSLALLVLWVAALCPFPSVEAPFWLLFVDDWQNTGTAMA